MLEGIQKPIDATKALLTDLESKKDFDFADIEKEEAGPTMGEAIRDAKKRMNAIAPAEVQVKCKGGEPEIFRAAKLRLEVLVKSKADLTQRVSSLGDEISENFEACGKCEKAVKVEEEGIRASAGKLLDINRSMQQGYAEAVNQVVKLQRKLCECRNNTSSMSNRIAQLREISKEKQKREAFMGLVSQTCFNADVDNELRTAIFNDIQASMLLDEKSSIFSEIEAKWESNRRSVSGLSSNLEDMKNKVAEANEKLGNNLQHWEKEKCRQEGTGLVNEWRLAKADFEKVKAKKDKIENMVYRLEPVPDALLEEFSRCKGRFDALDASKSDAEKVLADTEPLRIKWERELLSLEKENETLDVVYRESKEELERLLKDHHHKRDIAAALKMDHMSLISADELRRNPPKSFSAKADKEKKEALVNFVKPFNEQINNASKVEEYHLEMRKIADISRIRREQLIHQEKEEEDLTKEQFLQKMLRELLGLEHDVTPGTAEYRWALNNLRRKKHLRNQKARSNARKAKRDTKRRDELLRQAEVMSMSSIINDLRTFGIESIEDMDSEDRLIEAWVLSKLNEKVSPYAPPDSLIDYIIFAYHQLLLLTLPNPIPPSTLLFLKKIIVTGEWNRKKLGKGVLKEKNSPIKKKVEMMEAISVAKNQTKNLGFAEKMKFIKEDTAAAAASGSESDSSDFSDSDSSEVHID